MRVLLIVLPLLMLLVACEDETTQSEIETILTGTWTVTNIGEFEDANCTGTLDYSTWASFQSLISMSFVFNGDGTVDLGTTVFGMTETETFIWTADESELCIDGECVAYTLSDDDGTMTFVDPQTAYCENFDGDELDLNETDCGAANFDWVAASCSELTVTKKLEI